MNFKQKLIITAIILLICTIGIYWKIHDDNLVINNFKTYTGIQIFIVKANYYDSGQSYLEIIIQNSDKKRLLANHPFRKDYKQLEGKALCPFLSKNSASFLYYMDESSSGKYGYILYCLGKDDNTLIMYEMFGD